MVRQQKTQEGEKMGKPMRNEIEQEVETEAEARARARAFVLEAIDEGRSPEDILDELTTFFDGDVCDLL